MFVIEKKKVLNGIIAISMLMFLYLVGGDIHILRSAFIIFLTVIYLIMIPKTLLSPKNVVFFYYYVWYGVAPMFANRYLGMIEKGGDVNKAYLMFFTTYTVAMMTLDYCENKSCKESLRIRKDLSALEKSLLFCLYAVALMIYVIRTGGISQWLNNANDAFFSRGGSGMFFLVFEYSAFLILYYAGKNKPIKKRIPYILLCLLTMFLCGSKSIALVMVIMLFGGELIKTKIVSFRAILFVIGGITLFVIGMYVRNAQYMQNVSAVISTSLNYFDTFDETIIVLRDFEPSFFMTILLPLNWIFMKIGFFIDKPYHDTSIWLTNIYYPESWASGGTHQWPVEIYLYLNFYYIFGIIFIVVYFCIIGQIYNRAVKEYGIWRFIYFSELMSILSHLRGGLFNYWYIYMIPFYVVLIMWEKKVVCPEKFIERKIS